MKNWSLSYAPRDIIKLHLIPHKFSLQIFLNIGYILYFSNRKFLLNGHESNAKCLSTPQNRFHFLHAKYNFPMFFLLMFWGETWGETLFCDIHLCMFHETQVSPCKLKRIAGMEGQNREDWMDFPFQYSPAQREGVPYQPKPRLTWAWGEGLRRGRRGTCWGGTPWVGRSSSAAAHCCCRCYSKSPCRDHCRQTERLFRRSQTEKKTAEREFR